jgi:predicted double-glycine peptidase
MAMIARAFGYGAGLSDAKLINQLGAIGGTTEEGTSVNGITRMAQAIGLKAAVQGPGPDVAWIAQQIRAGQMVVANGDYYEMDAHRNVNRTSGHFVAVVGMQGDNFIVNDPADQAVHTVSPEELARFIRSNTNGGYQVSVGR